VCVAVCVHGWVVDGVEVAVDDAVGLFVLVPVVDAVDDCVGDPVVLWLEEALEL